MALHLDISRTHDIAVIRCRGRIVFGKEADELRLVLLGLLKDAQRIVLNLAWVEYIDSSGLGMLVASFISARHREPKSNLQPYRPTPDDCLRSQKRIGYLRFTILPRGRFSPSIRTPKLPQVDIS